MDYEKIRREKGAAKGLGPLRVFRPTGRDSGPSSSGDGRIWLLAVPIAVVTVIAFIPTLGNGFVDWDDEINFLHNRDYRGLGLAQVKWAWSTFRLSVYQPLAWLLFELQYVVWKLDPRGYHLTSVLLHAANAAVLYVLTVSVIARCRAGAAPMSPWESALGAAVATVLYAVHPLRVEVVAWASCQPYLPCLLFSMLATLAYLRAVGTGGPTPRWGWLAAAFGLFAAALLSKAVAVSLPAVLLILDVYPLGRLGGGRGRWFGRAAWRVWWEKAPFFLLSLVFMGLAITARRKNPSMILDLAPTHDVSARIARACYGIWFYIAKTLVPMDITTSYPVPERIDWAAPPFLWGILGTVAMTVGLFVLRRRRPGLLAAWFSYLVILAPNLGLIRISNQIAADRYSYAAMLGGVMLAAVGLGRLGPSLRRVRPAAIGLATVASGTLVLLIVLTWLQCRTWRSTEALWTHAMEHGAGASCDVLNALGLVLYKQGKLEEAAARYAEALRINPEFPAAHNNLAVLLFQRGKPEEAAAHYAEALRSEPDHAGALNNLAMMLAACPEAKYRNGKRAVEFATRACELADWTNPSFVDTLAAAYAEAGDFEAAVASQNRAIGLLLDDRELDDYRSRLTLYQAKKTFHVTAPGDSPAEVQP
jgi:tetratricopeptide (TPR) repeat protein